jgi:putative selenium metabolism hydrolase
MNRQDNNILTGELVQTVWSEARALREPVVAFARRLIRTPSLPGHEADVASLIADEMQALGYDRVEVDEAGNVIGLIRATAPHPTPAGARRIMLNTHMDHVDVGDPSRWPFPPYEAVVQSGHIWGRGASDLKGALACQVYTGAVLKRLTGSGVALPNDVYVACVVLEELGGLGSAVLADNLPVDYVILGEPSGNQLALGHRGRIEIAVTITGKSVHASVPETGVNPLYSMARFLLAIERLRFEPDPMHQELGPTTIAPTLISTDQTSPNVVPGECRLSLDVRNSPADEPQALLDMVAPLVQQCLQTGATGRAEIPPFTLTGYTGLTRTLWGHGAYAVSPHSPQVQMALSILRTTFGRDVPAKMWRFATDAGYFVQKGAHVLGFGPGYEDVIHTVEERISIDMMVEAMAAYTALSLALK